MGVQQEAEERTMLVTVQDIQIDNQIFSRFYSYHHLFLVIFLTKKNLKKRPYETAICPSLKSRPPVFTFETKRTNFDENICSLERLSVFFFVFVFFHSFFNFFLIFR